MKLQDFKKAVYELAKFNSLLTKGYRKEWKESDYDGYTKKNKELNKLVNIAKQKKYPIFYDGRTNVIYFIFGEVQISFHMGGGFLNSENFGLPHTPIQWDGVKEAFKYSEKEYLKLKNYRKKELQKRINARTKKENELLQFVVKYIDGLNQKLKRARTEKTKSEISKEINLLSKESTYGLYEYFRHNEVAKEICKELTPMYFDSYIATFSV